MVAVALYVNPLFRLVPSHVFGSACMMVQEDDDEGEELIDEKTMRDDYRPIGM